MVYEQHKGYFIQQIDPREKKVQYLKTLINKNNKKDI